MDARQPGSLERPGWPTRFLKKTVWVAESYPAQGGIQSLLSSEHVNLFRTQFFFQKNRVRHPIASRRYGPVHEGADVFVINPEKPHAVMTITNPTYFFL
jgi:hypothetical protein